jgi:hypothetical protein
MSRKEPTQTLRQVLRLPGLDFAGSRPRTPFGPRRSDRIDLPSTTSSAGTAEPRLAFNKTVVLRYRLALESRRLSSSTISLCRATVRRLANEAADTGLLSPESAADIRRVKGANRVPEAVSLGWSRFVSL